MSHFLVLVIGTNVECQLAPYHEFECTGKDDQYVQDIDKTDEARAEFGNRTEDRLKAPDGTLHSFFDEKGAWRPEFSQLSNDSLFDKTRRERFVPEGYEVIQVPASDLESFTEFASDWYGWEVVPFGQQPDLDDVHKYGYILVDEQGEVVKCIDRTNPNKHWDWWVIGGRWSGFLKLKGGATGELGRKGLMGSCANDGEGRADVALKGAIDFEGMRDKAAIEARDRWDKAALTHDGQSWDPWSEIGPRTGYDDVARETYNKQPAVVALKKVFTHPFDDIDQYLKPRDQFIQQARESATVPYALVKDGQWIAKGDMGWFGMSRDKVEQADWNRNVNELLDSLPDDTPITVVDCHT